MAVSESDRDRLGSAVAVLDKREDGSEALTAVVKTVLADGAPIVRD
jgi:hypothetical protein